MIFSKLAATTPKNGAPDKNESLAAYLMRTGIRPRHMRWIAWLALLAGLIAAGAELVHAMVASEVTHSDDPLMLWAMMSFFTALVVGKLILSFASYYLPEMRTGWLRFCMKAVSIFCVVFLASQVLIAQEKLHRTVEIKSNAAADAAKLHAQSIAVQQRAIQGLADTAEASARSRIVESRVSAAQAGRDALAGTRQVTQAINAQREAAGSVRVSDRQIIEAEFGAGAYSTYKAGRALAPSLMSWVLMMLSGWLFRAAREQDAAMVAAGVLSKPAAAAAASPAPSWIPQRVTMPALAAAGVAAGTLLTPSASDAKGAPTVPPAISAPQLQDVPDLLHVPPAVQTSVPQAVQQAQPVQQQAQAPKVRKAQSRKAASVRGHEARGAAATYETVRADVLALEVRPSSRELKARFGIGTDTAADYLRRMGAEGHLLRSGKGWRLIG